MLDFLGIGAQKCGTTWLYEMLRQNPGIAFPGGKEIHFWDNYGAANIGDYRSLFAENERKQGEITPAYAFLPPSVIERIHEEFPAVRLIFIMRNPVERAWSAAKMMLTRIEMSLEEASDQWFIDVFRSQGSLNRGDYAKCLRNWLDVFPRQQLHIERYESIEADPAALLRRCTDHIGAPASKEMSGEQLARRVFASGDAPLRESLRPVLNAIYAPKIRELEDFLQEDFSAWTIR